MNRFKRFFTGSRPSSSAETKSKVKRTINKLEIKIRNYQRQADEQEKVAYRFLKAGNRVAAAQALKRKEYYMKQVSNAYAQIANLQRTIDTIDAAETSSTVVDVTVEATKTIKATMNEEKIEKAQEAMMSLEETIEMSNEMDEILTDTSITDVGMDAEVDDRIAAQMAQMEAQLASGELPTTDEGLTTPDEIPMVAEDVSSIPEKKEAKASKSTLSELDKLKKQLEEGLK